MTALDVFIDGTPLNTAMSGVDSFKGRRGLAGRRVVSVTAPGGHGVIPVTGAFEPWPFSLGLWVKGGPDGSPGTLAALEWAIGDLLGVFAKPGLMNVDWVAPDYSIRRGAARLLGSTEPEIDELELLARFTVALELPRVFWRGADLVVNTSTVFNAAVAIPLLGESTAAVMDAEFVVVGPATSPRLSTSRGFVQYMPDLLTGETLSISNGTLQATLDGTPVTVDLRYGGSNPRFLDLYPGDAVTCTAGGTTIASLWTVAARPSYL